MPLDEYLKPRLLVPLGIEARWQHDPKGHAQVHAGVIANALDLAKVGVLLANDGLWQKLRTALALPDREAWRTTVWRRYVVRLAMNGP